MICEFCLKEISEELIDNGEVYTQQVIIFGEVDDEFHLHYECFQQHQAMTYPAKDEDWDFIAESIKDNESQVQG